MWTISKKLSDFNPGWVSMKSWWEMKMNLFRKGNSNFTRRLTVKPVEGGGDSDRKPIPKAMGYWFGLGFGQACYHTSKNSVGYRKLYSYKSPEAYGVNPVLLQKTPLLVTKSVCELFRAIVALSYIPQPGVSRVLFKFIPKQGHWRMQLKHKHLSASISFYYWWIDTFEIESVARAVTS